MVSTNQCKSTNSSNAHAPIVVSPGVLRDSDIESEREDDECAYSEYQDGGEHIGCHVFELHGLLRQRFVDWEVFRGKGSAVLWKFGWRRNESETVR